MQSHANETTPQTLADTLDRLAQAHTEDRATYKILAMAREQLRTIAWERFKARHERADRLRVMRHRHQRSRAPQNGHSVLGP
jgi:hypothetical protein